MNRKIFFGLAMLLILSIPAVALEYQCYTKDGKIWDCDIPIEKLFEDTEKSILDSKTEVADSTSISVFGTDYFIGETNATTFLQLLNSTNEPITNSSCFVSMWKPDKTIFISNATMTYLDEGLFYRDYNLPQDEGVYMISAKCTLPKMKQGINYENEVATDGFETGTFSSGTGWNDDWIPFGELYSVSTTQSHTGTYSGLMQSATFSRSVDLTDYKNLTISFWYYLQSIDAGETARFRIHDGTMQTIATWDDTQDDATWYQFNYTFEEGTFNPTCNFMLWFELVANGLGDYFYLDDVNISGWKYNYTEVLGYQYQEIRGSGEVHVINPVSTIINSSSLLDEILWNFQFDRDNPTLLSNHDYCIDNMTLGKTLTFEYCVGSNCRQIVRNETIPCAYGCNEATSSCNANPLVSVGIIMAIIIGFAIAVWEVLKRT